MAKLKEGTEIKVVLPFQYTIGEEGFYTGEILETVEDCVAEARAELEQEAQSFYFEAYDEEGELIYTN